MEYRLPESVSVSGVDIRFGVTGHGGRDLILIHGNGAHHVWWHRVVPLLADKWRIILLDLSGHGDSGYRDRYSPDLWAREVLTVAERAGAVRPVLVGHSMGGRVAISAAAAHPSRIAGLIVVDTSIRPPSRYRDHSDVDRGAKAVYRSREDALRQFKLLPRQPRPPAEVLTPIAEYSVKAVADGWTWKFDPRSLLRFDDAYVDERASRIRCPLGFIYGSKSVVADKAIADYARRVVPGPVTVAVVEGGHHHVILDFPEECASLIDGMARAYVDGARPGS